MAHKSERISSPPATGNPGSDRDPSIVVVVNVDGDGPPRTSTSPSPCDGDDDTAAAQDAGPCSASSAAPLADPPLATRPRAYPSFLACSI